jgi:hypothetical protein
MQVVSMLLDRSDILVNQKGKDGVTALGLACLQGQVYPCHV